MARRLPHCRSSSAFKAHGSLPARDLAAWLSAHLRAVQFVERERYLVIPAEDIETLNRCTSLEASLRRIGLPLERIGATELTWVLNGFLTPRPRQGAAGPAVVDASASDSLVADGLFWRAFGLGKLPPTIVTDWATPRRRSMWMELRMRSRTGSRGTWWRGKNLKPPGLKSFACRVKIVGLRFSPRIRGYLVGMMANDNT